MSTDALTATFAALADPTRRAILDRLADGEATVNELAQPFAMTTQAVSRHIGVLEQAGLIARRPSGTRRLSRIDGAALHAAADYLARYEPFWTSGFAAMSRRLDG